MSGPSAAHSAVRVLQTLVALMMYAPVTYSAARNAGAGASSVAADVFAAAVECSGSGVGMPCSVPSDKMYAHLVGMYLAELANVSIAGTPLEGGTAVGATKPNGTMEFLLESLLAYQSALQQAPHRTSVCDYAAGHALLGACRASLKAYNLDKHPYDGQSNTHFIKPNWRNIWIL